MRVWYTMHTYNVYGGHRLLEVLAGLLSPVSESFGAAIKDLELHAHFRSAGRPRESLSDLYARHHSHLKSLPTFRFERKKGRLVIHHASSALTAEDLELSTAKLNDRAPARLRDLYLESLTVLDDGRAKMKRVEDFDFTAYVAWAREQACRLPSSLDDLQAVEEEFKRRDRERRSKMDEWEKLEVQWDDYHPQARKVLDAPFFWDRTDGFAPHGNDTGADLLTAFEKWRRRNPDAPSRPFLKRLLRGWGLDLGVPPDDETSRLAFDDAAIALAFAHFKLDGSCPDWARKHALDSIRHQQNIVQSHATEWVHAKEKQKAIDRLVSKLSVQAR